MTFTCGFLVPLAIPTQTPGGIKKIEHAKSSITKMKESLNDTNWVVWCERIRHIFRLCNVEPYVYGRLMRPDPATTDPAICDLWDTNDVYAQILITNNISKDQMVHVKRLNTAHEIWQSLQAIHETKDYQIAISIQRTLFRKCASDGDDIVEHLTQLKRDWERLNVLEDADFRITDIQFKTIIASSLPPSWDIFTEPYVGRRVGVIEADPKKLTSSQEFIGILKEEYKKRKERNDGVQKTYYTNPYNNKQKNRNNNQSSAKRIQPKMDGGMLCRNCGHDSHITDNCRWLGQPKCSKCGWFGHIGADCRRQTFKWKGDDKGEGQPKKSKKEQVNHIAENGSDDDCNNNNTGKEEVNSEITFSASNADITCTSASRNDDAMILYDWLADSATTSHVTNMRDAFITFTPLEKSVHGVGNVQTRAEGKGDIKIISTVNGKQHQLTLKDVLYIPKNQQNLLSLGRWDKAGGNYHGGQGKLSMIASNGATVATGTKIQNNLYKLDNFITQLPPIKTHSNRENTFNATNLNDSWETWHKRFGHLGNSSIKTLIHNKLVTGLNVDLKSPRYDCEACVQAKQHVAPFPKASISVPTKPGEVTHMDLWGKYPVQSLNGYQYFHSFLDDSTR